MALLLAAALQSPLPATAAPDLTEAARTIVERTNQLRATTGAAPTARNPRLDAAAREFAEFMAGSGRYSHDADGRDPAQRARAQHYDFCLIAENIAYRYSSAGFETDELARGFFDGWAASPGHRRNMLDTDAAETGVAMAQSASSGHYYAVQMFGRPQALQIRFEIGNRSPRAVGYEFGGTTYTLPPNATRTHETCRVGPLQLHLPGETNATTLRPAGGASYRVEQDGSRYRVSGG